MAEYQAKEGQEDRHGEMTGAITIRYIIVMPPVMIWCVLLAPLWMNQWWNLGTGLGLSVLLTAVSGPLSRWIWAHLSEWMDRSRF